MSRLLFALVFALLLPATALADLRSPVVGDTSLLSDVPQSRTWEPTIATDGNRTFVAYTEQRTGATVHAIGASGTEVGAARALQDWGTSSVETPQVAVSGEHVYVAWIQGSHALPERHAVVAASHDGGRTFGRPVRAGRPTGHGAWDLRLAADGETVFVAYVDNVNRIWTAGSRDGADSFTCFAVVSEPGDGGRAFDVAVDGERVYWSWLSRGDDVMVRRSPDAGRSLEPLERVYEGASGTPVLAADGGTVALAFGQRFRVDDQREVEPRVVVSKDGGTSWQTHTIGSRCLREYCAEYALDVDAGRVYVAWRAQGQMWLGRSETGFAPHAMGPYLASWYAGRPSIDVHGDSVSAVWHSAVAADNPELDPVAAFSSDRGKTFSLRTISDAPGFDMLPVTAAWGPEPAGAGFAWWTSNVEDVRFAPLSAAEPDVAVLDVRPFQAADDAARLAAGRPTTIRAELRSLAPRRRSVGIAIEVTHHSGGERETHSYERRVMLSPGRTTVHLLADERVTARKGRMTARIEVLPSGPDSDPANNIGEGSRAVVQTRPLRVLFVPVHAADEAAPVCRDVQDVAEGTERYVEAAWPVDPETFSVVSDCAAPLAHPAGIDEQGLMADGKLLSRLDRLKLTASVDKVIGVVPQGWFSRQEIAGFKNVIGIAPMGGNLDTGIVERQATGGWLVAHELAHNLGFEHLDDKPAPGYWVAEKRDLPATTIDFLHPTADGADLRDVTGRWTSAGTWDDLITTLTDAPATLRAAGPSVLALSGSVKDGAMTAGPAFELEGEADASDGAYTAEQLAADGTVLARQDFGVATDLGEVRTATGAFSLRMPSREDARTLRIRRGEEVLLERRRSAAKPALKVTVPARVELGEDLKVTWDASDADGDALTSQVSISIDGGATWRSLGDATTAGTLTAKAIVSLASDDVRVRVTTTDGWNTTTAESDAFVIGGQLRDGLVAVPTTHRLYTVGLDGSGLKEVSTKHHRPSWSPDGRRITMHDGRDLWVINADGTGERKVTDAPYGYQYLFGIWAPDSESVIASKRWNYGSGPNVAVDVATGTETQHPAEGYLCEFSRDGSRLVAGQGQWTLMRPDGSERVPLEIPGGTPATGCLSLSPDGNHAVAEGMIFDPNAFSDVYLWDLRTGEKRNVTAGAFGRENRCPRFTPTGEWIVFVSGTGGSGTSGDIWKIRPDGTGAAKILDAEEHNVAWTCPDVQPLRTAGTDPEPTLEERDPVAKAAPAEGTEGTAIALDASASTPGADDAAITTYAWDLDGDGSYDDATGAKPGVTFPDEGTYTATVLVTDAGGRTATATTEVTVTNAAPVLTDAKVSDTGLLTARIADAGATDTLTATVHWGRGAEQTVPLIATGDGHRLSATGPTDTTVVSITVTDRDGGTAQGVATRVVTPVNGAPTAADATVAAAPGESVDIALPATDPEGELLRYEIVDAPAKGSVQVRVPSADPAAADVTYTADEDEGPVTFTYRATDGTGTSATATVTVDVTRAAETPPPPLPSAPPVVEPARQARVGTKPVDQRAVDAVTAPAAPTAAEVVTFPSAKACVSKRHFPIHVKRGTYKRVVVHVNGKRVKVRNRAAGVDLRGLPKGRFKVTIAVTLKSGKVVKTTRHFRTCTAGDKNKKKKGARS